MVLTGYWCYWWKAVDRVMIGRFRLPLMLAVLTSGILISIPAFADAEKDYNTTCAACHNLGVAGAPRLGDYAAWKSRIAQGNKTLYDHAINGYSGESGVMPPKGGFIDLSNNRVKAIVEFMVFKAVRAAGD